MEDIFTGYGILRLFVYLSAISPLSSESSSIVADMSSHLNHCFPGWNVSFFPGYFYVFYLSLVLSSVWYAYTEFTSYLSHVHYVELLKSINLGSFSAIFFYPILSLYFSVTSITHKLDLLILLHKFLRLYLFIFFSLLFTLDTFYWPISQFTESFFCQLYSAKFICWFFFFRIFCLQFYNLCDSFSYILFIH